MDANGGGRPTARVPILLAIGATILIALLPLWLGSHGRGKAMREGLRHAIDECRTQYASAKTAADTARADAWIPTVGNEQRPADPACGKYRQRGMLKQEPGGPPPVP